MSDPDAVFTVNISIRLDQTLVSSTEISDKNHVMYSIFNPHSLGNAGSILYR